MRFCIVGTGRCGTTLLREMLNTHPDVFVFAETHWIPKMYECFGEQPADLDALVSIVRRTLHVTGLPVTPIDVHRLEESLGGARTLTVREFCDRLGKLAAAENGKATWADKTPDYGPHMETLQRLWPECRFIHLIRNGAAVACSMSRHPGYRWLAAAAEMWWGGPSFNSYYTAIDVEERPLGDFVALWHRRFIRIRDESTRIRNGSLLEIRFEDLVKSPTDSLRTINGFLGLDASDDTIAEAVRQIRTDKLHSHPTDDAISVMTVAQRATMAELGYL